MPWSSKLKLYQQLHSLFSSVLMNSSTYPDNTAPKHPKSRSQYLAADSDIHLFWHTHRFYYVKRDNIIDELEVNVDGAKIVFDVSELRENRNHKKRRLSYRVLDKKMTAHWFLQSQQLTERGKRLRIW